MARIHHGHRAEDHLRPLREDKADGRVVVVRVRRQNDLVRLPIPGQKGEFLPGVDPLSPPVRQLRRQGHWNINHRDGPDLVPHARPDGQLPLRQPAEPAVNVLDALGLELVLPRHPFTADVPGVAGPSPVLEEGPVAHRRPFRRRAAVLPGLPGEFPVPEHLCGETAAAAHRRTGVFQIVSEYVRGELCPLPRVDFDSHGISSLFPPEPGMLFVPVIPSSPRSRVTAGASPPGRIPRRNG